MKFLVEALDTYEINNMKDLELSKKFKTDYIPKPGEQFVINKDRLDVLTGNNKNKLVYVKVVKELKPDFKKNKKKEVRKNG